MRASYGWGYTHGNEGPLRLPTDSDYVKPVKASHVFVFESPASSIKTER